MADENKEIYTGTRYLLDAKNSRQYAIRFENGVPEKPVVFAANARDQGFKPNETIFAFDDDSEAVGGNGITTTLYQIKINAEGEVEDFKLADVQYEKVLAGTDVLYRMDLQSQRELMEAEFDTNSTSFPSLISPQLKDLKAAIAREKVKPRPIREAFNPPVVVQPRKDYKVGDSAIEGVIKGFCVDLSQDAEDGRLDPVVGRDAEIDQALKVLTRRKQSSLCFTGEAGVGKTAMFAGVAQRLKNDPNLPEAIANARILQLDLEGMNAGAKFRGQFEEKLKPLIDGLAEREGMLKGRKIILAIDELHSQLTSGKAEGGSDAGNMMKPFLASKGVSVMGTTTDEEYKKHIEKDGALASRFEKLRLDPPDADATFTIISKLWPLTKAHNGLTEDLSEEDIRYIITMTNRYAPQEAQPRKSEKVMNMAAASAQLEKRTTINRSDMVVAIAQMSKLSPDFLNQSDFARFLKMEEDLPKEVLGQPGIIRVTDGLIGSRSGLNDPNQPWGAFVFQGPTGTGKTELCKALARYLLGTEDALIQLNMSEYSEKHTVSRLIGAPPGYVGFDSAEPALTEQIRNRPYAILLLDEIEKAHPDVFNVFLSILNDGKMKDNQGKTVLFNNVIVVMTTNAGAAQAMQLLEGNAGLGFGAKGKDTPADIEEKLSEIYAKAREARSGGPFRPEMINRIEELGGFITFLPLDQKVISKLVTREIGKVNTRLSAQEGSNLPHVTLEVSKEVMEQLCKDGYNPAMGARPLRKVIREKISNPLGKWVMNPENKEKLEALVAKEGSAKIVISSLETGKFDPEVVKGAPVSNDNTAKKPAKKKVAAPVV